MLTVNEIFYSIQGESTWTGLPFVFVRLSGCNLRCRFCDTQYAYEEGVALTVADVLRRVADLRCPRVTLTGGEPLWQDQTPELATALLDRGYQVTVETNGSLDIGRLDRRCIRIMDVKCPSSGMQPHNRHANLALLEPRDEVKFVVADQGDFAFASNTIRSLVDSGFSPGQVLVSPVHGILPPERLARWVLETRIPARMQIQLHKVLWPDHERGV